MTCESRQPIQHHANREAGEKSEHKSSSKRACETAAHSLCLCCSKCPTDEVPFFVIQRACAARFEPSRDAVEMIRVTTLTPRYGAILSVMRFCLACNAGDHELVVATERRTKKKQHTRQKRQTQQRFSLRVRAAVRLGCHQCSQE
jgi:hypothetical protein